MKVPLTNILKPPKEFLFKEDSSPQTIITSNIITTPCEKVLSILLETKNFIQNNTKGQFALIANLDWAIDVISSRSLYSYEIKEKEKVKKLSQENPEFKELVEFVSEYNEKVINMNRRYNYILTDKLLQKPSINLTKKKLKRKSSFNKENPKLLNILESQEKNNYNIVDSEQKNTLTNKTNDTSITNNKEFFSANNITKINKVDENKTGNKKKKKVGSNKNNRHIVIIEAKNANDKNNKTNIKNAHNKRNNGHKNQGLAYLKGYFKQNSTDIKTEQKKEKSAEKRTKNKFIFFPSVQKISITINNNDLSNRKTKRFNTNNSKDNRRLNIINDFEIPNLNLDADKKEKEKGDKGYGTDKLIPHISKSHFPFVNIQKRLIKEGYDISEIINEKNFDIFNLKDIIGYNNVLPFVGRVILENLGLIDEEILCVKKLDPFLIAVNNQYKSEVLYHNCLHGSDVTQSCYIFFTYTNAEKIAETNVLDLLSIFIAALGHDIAHPGLTNTFHINDSTDIAITYNDISVLENFHASTLFRTIRRSETNIFEKLTPIDYKIIRKRIVSEILATDMALHGKVLSLIKSKMIYDEDDNTYKLNLISGDEKTKSDEQQSLLDFMIHLADLAHNTRLFYISIKWVELLSEEFWRQGDLEKELNLPVSFLCDRENVNIPQSQKGFISGFILSTYECLGNIFPALRFTYENANNNLKEWQKLLNEGRKRGWTPKKDENKINKKKIKRAITKTYEAKTFQFFKGKKDTKEKNDNNDSIDEILIENFIKKKQEEKDDKPDKMSSIKSVKNSRIINLNLVNIPKKNLHIKKSLFNTINNDINRRNNYVKTFSSKYKLSINDDDYSLFEDKQKCSEFKLFNSKGDKVNNGNKTSKCKDKFVSKKNVHKKKFCK